jgi:hypothetical protein
MNIPRLKARTRIRNFKAIRHNEAVKRPGTGARDFNLVPPLFDPLHVALFAAFELQRHSLMVGSPKTKSDTGSGKGRAEHELGQWETFWR